MIRLCVVIVLAGSACKERGTISVPSVTPCDDPAAPQPTAVAVYLKRGVDCASIACGLQGFSCEAPGCIASCADEQDGYCATEDLDIGLAIDPPSGGDYALVMSYRYPGAATDQGLACFDLQIEADGTQSKTISSEGAGRCYMP